MASADPQAAAEDLVATFLDLACLTYRDDDPERWGAAA